MHLWLLAHNNLVLFLLVINAGMLGLVALLAGGGAVAVSGPQVVRAEMPGKIVKVKAARGDAVGEGQGLVIVEAMKMENEIVAHRDGVVSGLTVAPGSQVVDGQLICLVEPPAAIGG